MRASAPLRQHCSMNMRRDRNKPRELTPEVKANVDRIDAIWSESRKRFGAGGAFLFGAFSNADAMYAPVVSRFASYSHSGERGVAGLYERDDGAAGLEGMGGGRARRAHGHAA